MYGGYEHQLWGSFLLALSGASDFVGSLSIASALAVGVSAFATITSFAVPGIMSFLWQWLKGAMGLLPKRKNVWGTVYDSSTKRPIPYARVQLLDRNHRVLETRIADRDGRYGFLATPESLRNQNIQILILPSVSGYLFPSHTPATVDSFVYSNLYYGNVISVDQETLINFDIPMDPVKAPHTALTPVAPSIVLGASVAAIADAGFWLGVIMVPLAFALAPSSFMFATLCVFIGTASLRLFGVSQHPFGTVVDTQTGHAMPFALITLNELSGKRVAFTVSDEQGRYFMVAPKGTYELTVSTPASIQPTRQFRQTIAVRRGWITGKLPL